MAKPERQQLPIPVMAALRSELDDLVAGDLVLVGCSGGADSLALAAATATMASQRGLRAGAVIIDHGLQGGSADVAETTAELCRGLGLAPVVVRSVTVGSDGGPEGAAREARYAAFDEVRAETGASAILLAHTRDDQAEAVLLALTRGSGTRSMAGIPPRRGPYRRPFLRLTRQDTEGLCEAFGLDWWNDPTNHPSTSPGEPPRRSLVRHRVLPVLREVLGAHVDEALARTAELAREDDAALAGWARDVAANAIGQDHEISIEVLAGIPSAVRKRVLRQWLAGHGAATGSLSRVHLDSVDTLIVKWRGQGPIDVPGGLQVVRDDGRLRATRRPRTT